MIFISIALHRFLSEDNGISSFDNFIINYIMESQINRSNLPTFKVFRTELRKDERHPYKPYQ